MTGTIPSEYRDLALDSSNEMMAYDSRWVLGRYAEAAWHILQAGHGRLRMGQMMFDVGDLTQAAADWLSAAACFDLATDPKRMREALDRAQQLDREGKIPPERRDLHAALKEREQQFDELGRKLKQFRQDEAPTIRARQICLVAHPSRELPGSPHLHANISGQAMAHGQQALAVESLDWALRFDPRKPASYDAPRIAIVLVR